MMQILAAQVDPGAMEEVDVSRADLWRDDSAVALLDLMRRREPIHFCSKSAFGPFWSLTRYEDIVLAELRPFLFSSCYRRGGITIFGDSASPADELLPMFLAMDGRAHAVPRRAIAPALGPSEIDALAEPLRRRTGELIDSLPVGERFDWAECVAVELTTQMLALLLDFPWGERRRLATWSDWAGDIEAARDPVLGQRRMELLRECGSRFLRLSRERREGEPRADLISRMLRCPSLAAASPREFLGHLVLLIIGGNDTTRNTLSALPIVNRLFPAEWRKIVRRPELAANAAQELIRWQTPLSHMRRTATRDTELGGRHIAAGDKVVMWYASANRDEAVFDDGDAFVADRPNARRHLAFGAGVHRCLGARLAQLQVVTLLEVLMERGLRPVQDGACERVASSFIRGYRRMPARLVRD
jgi:cytochrome P450